MKKLNICLLKGKIEIERLVIFKEKTNENFKLISKVTGEGFEV